MRIVIKIGTSTLAYPNGRLNIRRAEQICRTVADIANAGNDVVIVSSGAIGMGVGKLSLGGRPDDIATKQAAAAVGQCELMYTYDRLFGQYNRTVGQILLTSSDFRHADRHANFRNTVDRLLELGTVPVVNENDTVATDEIKFGDNDTLSALVATSIGAELLVILSDVSGLYTSDPRRDPNAKLIPRIDRINDSIYALAGGTTGLGTGGMKTKLGAADICLRAGCECVIASGHDPSVLYGIIAGEDVTCTRFVPSAERNREND
jgi:glutamate 5-kinase